MSVSDPTFQAPYSQEAEQVVLGSMLAAPNLIADVISVLPVEDFYEPKHATIGEHLRWLSDEGQPVEKNSLITRLREHGELDKVGGPEYIYHLARQPSVPSAMYYAETVAEDAMRRKVIAHFTESMRNAQHGNGRDVRSVVSEAVNGLDIIS